MVIYTTKTNYRISTITAQIASPFARDLDKKCFVFCEDKNTLSTESEIARLSGGSFNIQVTSFSRYIASAKRCDNVLSKTGSTLAIFRIMTDLENSLSRLKLNGSASFASNVYQLIAQLKSAKVTPNELETIIEREDGAFATKLKDICQIYDRYEREVKESGYLDSNTFYGLIPQIVCADERLKGAKVVFSGFSSLTKQIIDIFSAFSKVCDCDFVLLKGDGEFYTNEIFDRVTGLFPNATIVEDDYRFSTESLAVEKGLFSAENYSKTLAESDKVHVNAYSTPYDEAEKIAKRIRYEVVKNGRRYKDFAIACSNPKDLMEIYKDKLEDFEIPLYVDCKTTMEKHPIIRFIACALTTASRNFDIGCVLSLARERLVCSQEELNLFEVYLAKYAISRKTIKKPFAINEDGDEICETVRARIIKICSYFKNEMTATEFVEAVKSVLSLDVIQENQSILSENLAKELLDEIAEINEQVTNKISSVLSEISMAIGERRLSATEFKTLFLSASASTEISILPLYNDMVYMGDFKSVKQREAKVLFAVNLTSDVPNSKQDIALLTDRDLLKMESYKCIIEPKIEIVNRRERENLGVSLMSFSDKLFLSYPLSDAMGAKCSKSEVIDDICNIFGLKSNNAREQDIDDGIFNYISLRQGMRSFAEFVDSFAGRNNDGLEDASSFYQAMQDLDKKEELDVIVGNRQELFCGEVTNKFSATVIESYFKCPYSCFAKYNLGLKEDENGEAQAFEFGNLLHLILEQFVADIGSVKSEEEAKALGAKLFDEALKDGQYARYLNKSKYFQIFKLIRREAENRCAEVFKEYQDSRFLPMGEEVAFGDLPGSKYKAITLKTPYGERYIRGKVDRIDKYNNHIRIIDYKTGNPDEKIKEEKLYSGTNIQLYLYPNAFLDENTKLGGVYYYKVDESFSDSEDVKCYIGRTLYDEDIVGAMDKSIEREDKSSKFDIKYKVTKSGKSLYKSKALLAPEELDGYVDYALKVAENGATELIEGNILPSPYEKSCEYCKFSGMCGYDSEVDNANRSLGSVDSSTIINALKEDGNNE